ncbi:unnamed protein product, partial [marine sediment metagenome]
MIVGILPGHYIFFFAVITKPPILLLNPPVSGWQMTREMMVPGRQI